MTSQQFVWTKSAVRRRLAHWICCPADAPPCSLWRQEVETVPGRHTASDWAAFQLRAHDRGDIELAMAELWPVTVGLNWESLTVDDVRNLPRLPQALWCVILRGPPIPRDEHRLHVKRKQRPASLFGFLPWKDAKVILQRRRELIQAEIDDAIGQIVGWLSPWKDVEESLNKAWRGFACTPRLHVWGVGGTPHPDSRCRCGRVIRSEWLAERAALTLETR